MPEHGPAAAWHGHRLTLLPAGWQLPVPAGKSLLVAYFGDRSFGWFNEGELQAFAPHYDALRKGGKLVQVGLFGGELNVSLPLMPIKALTIQGSYVGNPKELRELVQLANEGAVPALPVTIVPQHEANDALMRLRDGNVIGRLILKSEVA